jgi:GT2 family glycosyltransferase
LTEAPEISVVVASRDRPVRLRWLLNALAEQSLEPTRFEVIVAHDSVGPDTARLLDEHPLAGQGTLRKLEFAPTPWSAGKLRNAGWRAARAPVVAFTDDDCRPPGEWLERALDAARRHPGAIVQGKTQGDPDELVEQNGAHVHSQSIEPPSVFAQTCNMVYPKDVLEAVGGFVEDPPLSAGEDTDLALRARKQGAPYVAAPEVLTYHAVEAASLPRRLRTLWRWQDLAWLVKRHPEVRQELFVGIFWKRTHVWFPFAALAAALSRRSPLWLVLAIPWLVHSTPKHGNDPNGRLREISEVPGRFAYDATEFAALALGSAKHRALLL